MKNKNKLQEKERDLIQNDLLEQLSKKGATQKFYTSLVEDYMKIWDIKNELMEDIENRGVSVEIEQGNGKVVYKKNESINELNKTNGQMLKILIELGLRGADIKIEVEDDEL